MPIFSEIVSHPSEQDLIDLQKIYDEFDAVPTPSLTWIEAQIADDNVMLVAARFNARLLGTVCVTKRIEAQQTLWILDHICVRKVTQGRGVATKLFGDLKALADEQGSFLVVATDTVPKEVEQYVEKQGFVRGPFGQQWPASR